MAKNKNKKKEKKNKQPKAAFAPVETKTPRAGITPETNKVPRADPIPYAEQPSWRLKTLDFGGPYGWMQMARDDLTRVVDRLRDLETMTWQAILQEGDHWNHAIDTNRLCKKAQDRLVDIKLDDIDSVISLRVGGSERVFGLRFGAVLRLLWWDPKHEVCPGNPADN
jgi:hypothetical protein